MKTYCTECHRETQGSVEARNGAATDSCDRGYLYQSERARSLATFTCAAFARGRKAGLKEAMKIARGLLFAHGGGINAMDFWPAIRAAMKGKKR